MKSWPKIHRVEIGLDFGGGSSRVGAAAAASGNIYFQFDEEFASQGINPSPIRMKLNTELQDGTRELNDLPGLLHDSLPDGWARLVLDRHIRGMGFDHTSLGSLDRLALVGETGTGALTYKSDIALPLDPPEVDFDTAAALVVNAPEEEDADRILAALTLMRSLGGALPKANIWFDGDRYSTNDQSEARAWILKFGAKTDGPEAGAVEMPIP